MAGNLPVPLGVEIKIQWDAPTGPAALTILHATNTSSAEITQARTDAIDSAIKTAYTSSGLQGVVHTGVSLARASVRDMRDNANPWWVAANAVVPGTGVGKPLPAATCFCVSSTTAKRGRSFNGRTYLWGYVEGANDTNGGITAVARDASVLFLNTVRTSLAGSPAVQLAILSRWTTPPGSAPGSPPTERNPPILTPVVTYVAKDSRWDVQRRRSIPGI